MDKFLSKLVITLLLSCLGFSAAAQRERNYIYLFDCTQSMSGFQHKSPDIWEYTKKYLKNDIERQSPNSVIHIVPFQNSAFPDITFTRKDFDWDKVNKQLDDYEKTISFTNICSAWTRGIQLLDPNKDNYMFLLTDGGNSKQYGDVPAVCNQIRQWCSHQNSYAFYVMLTDQARDPRLKEAASECERVKLIDANDKVSPFGAFNVQQLNVNTLEMGKKVYQLSFSTEGTFGAAVVCNDPYFTVTLKNGKIANGKALFQVSSKYANKQLHEKLGDQYEFHFQLKGNGVNILNPDIQVNISNKEEKTLTMISEETPMKDRAQKEKVTYYSSFLFCKESQPDTLFCDLAAVFNAEAVKNGSLVTFKVSDNEDPKSKDFTVLLNGQPCAGQQFELDAKTLKGAVLGIVFNHDAESGKRYFKIEAVDNGMLLDRINEDVPQSYSTTVRGAYNVDTNPLKLGLIWFGVILIASLLVWFICLRRMFFPVFKVGTITVSSPYYKILKLRGVRQLVWTNTEKKQNLFSLIFTGKVLYEVHAFWTDEWVMTPSSTKGLRIKGNPVYVVSPYASCLSKCTPYDVTNTKLKDQGDANSIAKIIVGN